MMNPHELNELLDSIDDLDMVGSHLTSLCQDMNKHAALEAVFDQLWKTYHDLEAIRDSREEG